jgi:hypothetical protein
MKSPLKASAVLLTLAGTALVAPSSHAQNVSYHTGDLLVGFELPGNASDYVIDIGPASTYLDATGPININTALSSNFGADLSSTGLFGSNWAANNATQGTNVQWGVIGATSNLLGGTTGSGGTFGLPKDTIFLTIAEPTPGLGSVAPVEYSQSTQGGFNTKVIGFAGTINNAIATSNSAYATIQSSSAPSAWSTENPSLNGFTTGDGIEQPTSGTYIGPTNSQLDLYELRPTNAGGSGAGTEIGDFQLSSGGTLTFNPVPEPSSLTAFIGGAAVLAFVRRRRHSVPA